MIIVVCSLLGLQLYVPSRRVPRRANWLWYLLEHARADRSIASPISAQVSFCLTSLGLHQRDNDLREPLENSRHQSRVIGASPWLIILVWIEQAFGVGIY